MAISGEDDQTAALLQMLNGVEELLLQALFAVEEVDIVDDERIEHAKAIAERRHGSRSQCFRVVIREGFGGEIGDLADLRSAAQGSRDSLEQMGFS